MNAKSTKSPEDILSMGRLELGRKWPYFSKTILGLIPRASVEIPTFAVTQGLVMVYNPEFVASLDPKMAASEMVHECSHVVRGHLPMFRNYRPEDRDIVNVGMDLAINPDIRNAGWILHPTWMFPKQYDLPEGLTAVEYIHLLLKRRNEGTRDEKEKLKELLGSSKTCFPPKGMEQVLDQNGRTQAEQKRIIKSTIQAIQAHAQAAGRGNVPGFLKDLITHNPEEARIPWRDRLEGLALHASGAILAGGSDFSLKRPSKRSQMRGLLRPGLVDHMINAALVIDTSASMNKKQMLIGMAESVSILEQMGIDRAWYLQADANISLPPEFLTIEELRNIPGFTGRGGTDFRPAIEATEKLSPRPEMVFYFTDGDGWAPPQPPEGMAVIWCIIPQNERSRPHRPADWGDVVLITDGPLREEDLLPPFKPVQQQDEDDE